MIYKCKFVICGDSAVGKTVLITQYIESRFSKEDYPTIGVDTYIKQVKEDFKIFIWEIGGAKHRLFASEYSFIQSVGAMVIFDITNQESFTNVDFWINKIKELCGNIPFVIIGNKLDKSNERRVKFKDANEKAKKHNVRYIETSAKTGNNIDKAFDCLVAKVSSLGMVKITNKELLNKSENENLKDYTSLEMVKREKRVLETKYPYSETFKLFSGDEEYRKEILRNVRKVKIRRVGDQDDDRYPYPYVFKPPEPPDDLALVPRVQLRHPPKKKERKEKIACQYCGMKLTKEEQFTHSCKKKPE